MTPNSPRRTPDEIVDQFIDWINSKPQEEKILLLNLWKKPKDTFSDIYKTLPQNKFEILMSVFGLNFAKTIFFYPNQADLFNIYKWTIDPKLSIPKWIITDRSANEIIFKNWVFFKLQTWWKVPYFEDLFSKLNAIENDKSVIYYKIFLKFKDKILTKLWMKESDIIIKNASQQIAQTLTTPTIWEPRKWINLNEPIIHPKTWILIATESGIIKDIPTVKNFVRQLGVLAKSLWWGQLRDLLLLWRLNPNNMRLFRKNDWSLVLVIYRQNIRIITQDKVWGKALIHKPIMWYQDLKAWLKPYCNDWLYLWNANFRLQPEENLEVHLKKVIQLPSDVKFARKIWTSAENQFVLPCWIPVVIVDSNVHFLSSKHFMERNPKFKFVTLDDLAKGELGETGKELLTSWEVNDWFQWISVLKVLWYNSTILFEASELS